MKTISGYRRLSAVTAQKFVVKRDFCEIQHFSVVTMDIS
jgi:hypothetical protein